MKNLEINLEKVKGILDNATWNYEFSGNAGSDVETACNYLDTQKFSIEKIKEFMPNLAHTDIEDADDKEEYLAAYLADV